MELIYIWPDGEWVYAFDYVQDEYYRCKSDDYSQIDVPDYATQEDIDYFVSFWNQSNQTQKDLIEWWSEYFPSKEV